MNHGTAIAKVDIGEYVKLGEYGIITAYPPAENIFAVDFGNGKWIRFDWAEDKFKNCFEIDKSTNANEKD